MVVVLRRALYIEIDGQRKKWRPKRTWKKQVEKKVCMLVCEGKMHFADHYGVSA